MYLKFFFYHICLVHKALSWYRVKQTLLSFGIRANLHEML